MRNTTLESQVNVMIDGKPKKGKIVEVISQGAARIELGDHSTIQASYSILAEDGSFHYPDEAEAVKAAKAEPEPTEAAAPPAKSKK